jgi:hypothetical protein
MLFNKDRTMWTDGTYDYWILDGKTYKVPCEKPSADFITPAQTHIIKVTNSLKGVALICTTIFVVLVIAFLLASCASAPAQAASITKSPQAAIEQTQTPQPTETIVPTATIDYLATAQAAQNDAALAQQQAQQAQAEADAAKRLMVDATVTHEAILLSFAQMTQAADVSTQQISQATMAVAGTYIPMTAQAQDLERSMARTQVAENIAIRTATAYAPTQISLIADAKANAETATARAIIDMVFKFCVSVMLLAVPIALVIFVTNKPAEPIINIPNLNIRDIPMVVPKGSEPTHTIRAEIPCDLDQLLELADGILNSRKTLAFNQWEGTSVHKSLKDLRAFFMDHKFARVLIGKGGELGIEADGEAFLREVWTNQSPPPPMVCLPFDGTCLS